MDLITDMNLQYVKNFDKSTVRFYARITFMSVWKLASAMCGNCYTVRVVSKIHGGGRFFKKKKNEKKKEKNHVNVSARLWNPNHLRTYFGLNVISH